MTGEQVRDGLSASAPSPGVAHVALSAQAAKPGFAHVICVFALALALLVSIGAFSLGSPSSAYAQQDGHPVLVAMGDSYSSGEGVEPFFDQGKDDKYKSQNWLAHRSEKAWPGKLVVGGQNLKIGESWRFVAASGAKTAHILGTDVDGDSNGKFTKRWKGWDSVFPEGEGQSNPPLPCQTDVFDTLPQGSVDFVTLTMGGNDVGFAKIVETAALDDLNIPFVTTGSLGDELDNAVSAFDEQTRGDLTSTYRKIAERAGSQANIIVADYPHLFPAAGRAVEVKAVGLNGRTPAEWIGVSVEDAELINKAVDVFDAGIREQVEKAGGNVHFVDVRSHFNGHENDYINPPYYYANDEDLDQSAASAYSVHPNEAGQEAYAKAVQAKIDEIESGSATQDVAVASDVAMSLVFDVSGSMDNPSALSGMSKLASAKKQSTDFVRSVGGQKGEDGGLSMRVGVVSFSNSSRVVCGLSNDPDDIAASIASLTAYGQTNMYAGLSEGITQLLGENGPRLMVYLSDGVSNMGGSREQILELADEAAKESIKVYTIGFGSSRDIDESLLREIADRTGGEYSHEDSANISSAAVGLFATMMNAKLAATSQVLHSIIGSVGKGATVDAGTFDITKGGTVQVYLYWPGSILDLLLTDPDGKEVKAGDAGVTVDTSTIPTSITIENAKQGTWSMAVHGQEVSMSEEPFYAVVSFKEVMFPTVSGGGAATNNGEGLLFVLLVVVVACIGGVFAYTKRRRSDEV